MSEHRANARLIAAAPAMDLMLRLIAAGRARFEQSTTCDLLEFCFDGMRYPVNDGDWNGVMNVIGWDRARDADALMAKEADKQFIPHAPRK